MSDTTDSLVAALNAAGIKSDNHMFAQRLMNAIGISGYHPKKQKSESYVIATRRDGLPDLRIYFGYTTGFTTADEAARLAKEFGVETGPSGKLKGKWFVGHPVNGGLGPRGGTARTKKPEPVRCSRCRIWELSASGHCPDCDDGDVRSSAPAGHGPKLVTVSVGGGARVDEKDPVQPEGKHRRDSDTSAEKTRRPGTRTDCPKCGRRVTVREDGALGPHLVRRPSDSEQQQVPRCSGGFTPPIRGYIVEVKPEPVEHRTPPPTLLEEGGTSVRARPQGLPNSNRRRH
jgi:predicted RNA-binding Zn-ribbon protein involved in translation (DUF1610 family)